MKQLNFPWLSSAPDPLDVPDHVVTTCGSEAQAVQLSLRLALARLGRTQEHVANLCGWQSSSFLSEIARDQKRMPCKREKAFRYATGCNLLEQYRERQRILREMTGKVTERDRAKAVVALCLNQWEREALAA